MGLFLECTTEVILGESMLLLEIDIVKTPLKQVICEERKQFSNQKLEFLCGFVSSRI